MGVMDEIVEYAPGPALDLTSTPECSKSGFCFFCAFSETGAPDDRVLSLKNMVRPLRPHYY